MRRAKPRGPMARFSNATPLIALDAFVLDTETTGLDPAKARIVEIGAVPLRRGKLDETAALRRLVNPGEAIPADATRIHAIDDSMVASAPKFAAVWPDVSAATSDASPDRAHVRVRSCRAQA